MSDEWEMYDVCPACGSTALVQRVETWERVEVGPKGTVEEFVPLDEIDVLSVECVECEETLFERESEVEL